MGQTALFEAKIGSNFNCNSNIYSLFFRQVYTFAYYRNKANASK
jgi:hypothetical protein